MTVRLICDSSQNVPQAYQESLGIVECPASIVFGKEAYLNKVEMSDAEFYRRLEALPNDAPLPTTTQPTPGQFKAAIDQVKAEGASAAIITAVSAKLSGTYNSAAQAAAMEQEIPVFAWDTTSASIGGGWQTIAAAELAQQGASLNAITQALPEIRQRTHVFFTVADLKHLVASGRLSSLQGLVGTLLSVKPMICIEDGVLNPVGRERGRRRAKAALIELLQRAVGDQPVRVAVANANVPEEAAAFAQDVQAALNIQESTIVEIGPVLAALAGPGVLALGAMQVEP